MKTLWERVTLLVFTALISVVPLAYADLLVSSGDTSEVLRYSDAGAFVGVFASGNGLSRPQGLAFGPDGNLYVANTPPGADNDNVLRFNGTSGVFIDVFATGGGLNTPRGLTFGADGNLYVSSEGSNQVLRYNGSTGAFINEFASVGGPRGLTFGADGKLYVASFGSDSVQRFDGTTGETFVPAADEPNPDAAALDGGPFGLTFGPDGNLYVGADGNNNVQRYDGATGHFIDVFASGGGLNTPRDLVFGPDGNLYVASRGAQMGDPDGTDESGAVIRYVGGTGSIFASGGNLDFPTFLLFMPAASPVPEPSALLLIGAGLAGLAAWRRSRK